jgi:hypothetical protein
LDDALRVRDGYEIVSQPFAFEEAGQIWLGRESDSRVSKDSPQFPERRQRHNRVANPVRYANQYAHARSSSFESRDI